MNKVIKRDGREVDFDKEKIKTAILKAFIDVDGEETEEAINIATKISDEIGNINKKLEVEEIQDSVESKLMSSKRKDVAKAYVIYRNERSKIRQKNSSLNKEITKDKFPIGGD